MADRSRDYCHATLGVSFFSFFIQNVLEITTMVNKIACCYVVHSVSSGHCSEIMYRGYYKLRHSIWLMCQSACHLAQIWQILLT